MFVKKIVLLFNLIKFFFLKKFIRKYKIRSINNYGFVINDYLINRDNELDKLFSKYGSDKGGEERSKYLGWHPHNYGQVYEDLFFYFRNKKFNFLEIGIGSINQNIKSSLPSHCKSGASLRAFRDYFYKAHIFGADIDKDILFKDKRISTFYIDQTSEKSVKDFFYKLNKYFLVIIDDGLHEFYANINLFKTGIEFLSPEGLYIIEDVNEFNMKDYYNYFRRYKKKYRINFYNLHNPKFLGKSNNVIVIRKFC